MSANTLINFAQGGATMNVDSGGVIAIDAASGLTIGGVANSGAVRGAIVTISAGQAAANAVAITTGFSTIAAAFVMVLDTGNNVVTSDADVTISGGTLTVADGSTYNTVEAYKLHWIAVGV